MVISHNQNNMAPLMNKKNFPKGGVSLSYGPALMVALVLSLWISVHPYLGLIHDSQLYTFLALAQLPGSTLTDDIFSKFGSQGNYTIYIVIFSEILKTISVGAAAFVFTILGQVVWVVGAVLFTKILSSKFYHRAIILICIIVLPGYYGGLGVFRYAEPFHSPRLFAEGLVLIAVAWGYQCLWWRCGLALILAGVLHPFMALAGVGVCFVLAAQRYHRLWLLVPIGALAFAGLAAIGIEPFSHIRSTVGGLWWTVVARRAAQAFISNWSASDFARLALQGLIFALAYRIARPDERRLIWATALVAVAGVLANLVGGDWLHNELFVEFGFCRTLWLWTVLANALAGLLILRMRDERPHIRAALVVGVAAYALDAWVPIFMPFVAAPVLGALYLATRRRPSGRELSHSVELALFAISVSAALSAVALLAFCINIRLGLDASRPGEHDYLLSNLGCMVLALLAAGLACRGFKKTAMGLLAGTIVVQAVHYDQRSTGLRSLDSFSKLPDSVAAIVDRSANIYWEDGVEQQWFALKRPAYFSCIQGAGVAFFKRTALEYYRRETALRNLNTDDFSSDPSPMGLCPVKADISAIGPTSREQLATVCRALPDLDLMVLYRRIPDAYSTEMPLPAQIYVESTFRKTRVFGHYYLYECRTLR